MIKGRAARKARAIEYEEYLKRIAELAKTVAVGHAEDTPRQLDTPGRRALYNNLMPQEGTSGGASATADSFSPFWKGVKEDGLELAIKIDETVKRTRPDDWRGVQAREQVVKASLYGVLQNEDEVERIFLIIKHQKEY